MFYFATWGDHVSVSDCLDLVDVVMVNDGVKDGVEVVKEVNYLGVTEIKYLFMGSWIYLKQYSTTIKLFPNIWDSTADLEVFVVVVNCSLKF